MSFDAPHVSFVIAAYAVSAVVLLGLIVTQIIRSRGSDRRLQELEAEGAPRRRAPDEATS